MGMVKIKKSLLLSYFTSYLIIGVLPVIIFAVIFYFVNVINLNKEVERTNYSSLTQSMYKMDYLQGQMSNIAYHMTGYKLLSEEGNNGTSLSLTDESVLIQRLKSYEEAFNIPLKMLLYIHGSENVYLSDAKYSYYIFEEDMTKVGSLTMSSFFTILNSITQNGSLKLVNNFTDKASNSTLTAFLYPIPYMEVLPHATLGFMIEDKAIKDIFDNYLGDIQGNIYIYNEYLQGIYSSEKIKSLKDANIDYAGMKGTGVSKLTINGVPCILMRAVSENSGFRFIVVMKERDFYNRVNLMQYVLFASVILLFTIGVLLAVFLTIRNYKPIKRLLKNIEAGDSKKLLEQSNEFEVIWGKWTDIMDKNQELSYMLNRQRPMVMNSCLSSLLKGKLTNSEELDFNLKCANINLSSQYTFVMLVSPANKQTFWEQLKGIMTCTNEIIYPMARMYSTEMLTEKRVSVVVNCDETEYNGEDIRLYMARTVQKNINDAFQIDVAIGIGCLYKGIMNINASFMEAMVVVSDYMAYIEQDIVVFEDVVKSESENYTYPVIEQAMYINSIKQADKAIALKSLDSMIEKINLNSESFLISQCLCYDIINMIIKTSNQINIEIKANVIKNLCSFNNVKEFRELAKELTMFICDQYEHLKEETKSKMKTELIDYVNKYFKDPNLSLESVADQFDISSNYLSHFFKQETGCNFIQYTTMLRMDWIKNQLIQSEKQIKDIVSEAGYLNVASFVRKFRSYEGVTPGQYREQMKNVK